jgi:UDP-N-acetylmuramate dehydrogenase
MVPMEKESSETLLVQELKQIAGVKVRVAEPLARYTSMKIGGPADYLLDVDSREALPRALGILARRRIPVSVLGNGSNVLVSDLGMRGAVIRLGKDFKRIEWHEEESGARVDVGAAFPVTQLVREAARRGYSGLEFAEGIPGSVGGALVMNAGAYGAQMDVVVEQVEAVTAKGEPLALRRAEIVFSYRHSSLPGGSVVTRALIRLVRGEPEAVRRRLTELVSRRKKSQPSGYPNSGSMFRNPPGDFAGRLIEAAGLKGTRVGRAEVSDRHGNFIVNLGGAKGEDVRQLMERVQEEVEKKFGVRLEPEVRLLGEWPARLAGE